MDVEEDWIGLKREEKSIEKFPVESVRRLLEPGVQNQNENQVALSLPCNRGMGSVV